ncbi:MAG: DUF2063 domain-containing protein [Opitutus sp.]|nr:DUF2063 domain-containing protein [Opitutus sp.]
MKALRSAGLKSPPRHAPRRLRTDADLRAFQRLMTHALVQPLTRNDDVASRFRDGRSMAEVVGEFIKPNDRLSSVERLQIYARSYWYRLIDCVYDDSPGLRALLGERKFFALVRAYLAKYPSRSFTMRNLCSRLPQFIREEPRWTVPDTARADAVARFEWAQTVAFDGEAHPVLPARDLAPAFPARLRLALQPYLSLLVLEWPVDDYVIAVKQRDALRDEASNVVNRGPRARAGKRVARPRRGRVYVVVHRYHERLFYKRLAAPAFKILAAIAAGQPMARAVAAAGRRVKPAEVQEWFATWMELGWFCRR